MMSGTLVIVRLGEIGDEILEGEADVGFKSVGGVLEI